VTSLEYEEAAPTFRADFLTSPFVHSASSPPPPPPPAPAPAAFRPPARPPALAEERPPLPQQPLQQPPREASGDLFLCESLTQLKEKKMSEAEELASEKLKKWVVCRVESCCALLNAPWDSDRR
jgi:hypothetical protein